MNKFNKYKLYQGLKPIKSVLPKQILKLNQEQGSSINEIKKNWLLIIGEDLAKISTPEKIKQSTNNHNRILFINVPKQFLLEIDYSRDYIIEKLNSYFGYNYIKKIIINPFKLKESNEKKIRQCPIIGEDISKKINLIKDEKLQNEFKNFFDKYEK